MPEVLRTVVPIPRGDPSRMEEGGEIWAAPPSPGVWSGTSIRPRWLGTQNLSPQPRPVNQAAFSRDAGAGGGHCGRPWGARRLSHSQRGGEGVLLLVESPGLPREIRPSAGRKSGRCMSAEAVHGPSLAQGPARAWGAAERGGKGGPGRGSQRWAELQASCGLQVAEPGEVNLSLGPVGALGTLVGNEPPRVGEVWTRQDQCGNAATQGRPGRTQSQLP